MLEPPAPQNKTVAVTLMPLAPVAQVGSRRRPALEPQSPQRSIALQWTVQWTEPSDERGLRVTYGDRRQRTLRSHLALQSDIWLCRAAS